MKVKFLARFWQSWTGGGPRDGIYRSGIASEPPPDGFVVEALIDGLTATHIYGTMRL